MIAKRIPKDPAVADSFKALALYIAEAREDGEKLEDLWIGNCDAGDSLDDLDAAIAEVNAVRATKPHVANKTYHLIISFRPEEQPQPGDIREIAQAFTHALGFEAHQWVAGTHKNTDNFHIHMAWNRVHPETLKVHSPWDDYRTLERTCREMEQRYNLQIDRGMSDDRERPRLSAPARDFEAQTWQQSFQGYCLENKDKIIAVVEKAKGWPDVHKGLAKVDLELKPRGNGLVFKRRGRKETAKASLVSRELSAAKLTKRFGPYQGPQAPPKEKTKERYTAKPLTRHPATSRLWRAYLRHKGRPPGFLGRLASNWKQFLMNEAYRDPLALVIIIMHKEMMNAIAGPAAPSKLARPALKHWMREAKLATKPDDLKGAKVALAREAGKPAHAVTITDRAGKTMTLGQIPKQKPSPTAPPAKKPGPETSPELTTGKER